ncbi:MAG: DUF1016 family protein [Bacteroidales bacterium]|nr:DUF1016 family protein [Bacteroidales bacterium]
MKNITPIEKSSLFGDVCTIIEQAQRTAYNSVNVTLIKRNWLLGMRIHKEILNEQRAEYGKEVIENLSKELVKRFGSGFTIRNLYYYLDFYQKHIDFFLIDGNTKPFEILHAMCAKSEKDIPSNILHTPRAKSGMPQAVPKLSAVNLFDLIIPSVPIGLSWSHYRTILQEKSAEARDWYEREATNEMWSTRTLQRNISSQYYHRMLMSQHKELVHQEMIEKTSPLQDKMEFIKNPVIAEFLGFPLEATFTESELETSIINNLQKFIMELGKGYAFVARQQHIHTEKEDYYIDLVFYNYLLKSFVLIDLKTTKVTHQDVGQMDMYVRMYDELKRNEGDNPTIGILICADTDEDIARYSILHDNDQLFAAKYKTYMPTDEELRAEIESQKNIYYLQKGQK